MARPHLRPSAVALQQRVVRPRHRGARGEQDQRVDERQAPGVEGAVEVGAGLGRPVAAGEGVALHHADHLLGGLGGAVGHGDLQRVDRAGEQRGVEVGPEPGDEEHHLRGDEQDHAVAQVELHDGRVVAAVRLLDHVAPPHEHDEQDAEEADREQRRPAQAEQAAVAEQRLHPDDQADRGQEHEQGPDHRPGAGVHEVIVVVLIGVGFGHLSSSSSVFAGVGSFGLVSLRAVANRACRRISGPRRRAWPRDRTYTTP